MCHTVYHQAIRDGKGSSAVLLRNRKPASPSSSVVGERDEDRPDSRARRTSSEFKAVSSFSGLSWAMKPTVIPSRMSKPSSTFSRQSFSASLLMVHLTAVPQDSRPQRDPHPPRSASVWSRNEVAYRPPVGITATTRRRRMVPRGEYRPQLLLSVGGQRK